MVAVIGNRAAVIGAAIRPSTSSCSKSIALNTNNNATASMPSPITISSIKSMKIPAGKVPISPLLASSSSLSSSLASSSSSASSSMVALVSTSGRKAISLQRHCRKQYNIHTISSNPSLIRSHNHSTSKATTELIPFNKRKSLGTGSSSYLRWNSNSNSNHRRVNYFSSSSKKSSNKPPKRSKNINSDKQQLQNRTQQQRQQHQQQQQQIRTLLSEASPHHHHNSQQILSSPLSYTNNATSILNNNALIQSLTTTLLKPRSLPLIPRWISPQHYTFNLSECFGHSSFLLVALSYYSDDFLQLRLMAVLGSTSMLVFTYFHPHGRILWLPFKWNVMFIAINSYRIGKVLLDRWRAEKMEESLKKFREDHLYVMEEVDFLKLVSIAREEFYEEGDVVLLQGFDNPYIRVVLEGELEVRRDGTLTYILEEGNFISEAGLHAGLMLTGTIESCASIVVGKSYDIDHKKQNIKTKNNNNNNNNNPGNNNDTPTKNKVRLLCWDRTQLIHLLQSDKSLRNSLKAALSWDIVRKLKLQRHMLTQNRVQNPAAWTRKREDQGISRYASILQNMLRHPEEMEDSNMSEVLTKYRMIHHIEDRDHEKALAKCGWTEEEFRKGKKEEEEEDFDDVTEEEFLKHRWRTIKRFSSRLVRSLGV